MKAIRKSDGKIIDVQVHGWQGDCAISYHTDFKDFYKPEDLDFNVVETKDVGTTERPFDWQSFRTEAAKDFTVAILSNPRWSEHFKATDKDFRFDKAYYKKVVIGNALSYTDELIKQLKEK